MSDNEVLLLAYALQRYVGVEFCGKGTEWIGVDEKTDTLIIKASIPKESTMSEIKETFATGEYKKVFGNLFEPLPRTRDDYIKVIKGSMKVVMTYNHSFTIDSDEELKEYCKVFIKTRDSVWTQSKADKFAKELEADIRRIQKELEGFEEV